MNSWDGYKKGFTLVEMIIVIVIIGMVAGFSLVNFNKAQECAIFQSAWDSLKAIHAAERQYYAKHRSYWPQDDDVHGLSDINDNLNIDITAQNEMTYSCSADVEATFFDCSMTRNRNGVYLYTIRVINNRFDESNPSCTGNCYCKPYHVIDG